LILANERSDHWSNIRDNTAGIIFFAVPHRGSDIAFWGNLATNVLKFATLGTRGNDNFVHALKRNSREFSTISHAFLQPARRLTLAVRTFYETEKIGGQLVGEFEIFSHLNFLLNTNVPDC
jgi:hypothetical protein